MTPPMDMLITYRSTGEFPTGELLDKCLETLHQHTHNIRVIVVDDDSDVPGSEFTAKLMYKYPNALYLRTGFQRWFSRAVNLGLSLVRTERCCVLNSDMVFGEGWLEEMLAVWDDVEKSGKVGLVCSQLSEEEPRRYEISVPRDYCTGHCWLLKMQALHEVANARNTPGRFLNELEQQYIHIRSDVELCWALHPLGYQCVKSFKSWVGHIGGRSWGHQIHRLYGLKLEDVNERYV